MEKIIVIGLGKIGALSARLLHEAKFDVLGVDLHANTELFPFPTVAVNASNTATLADLFKRYHAVLSCLPYHFNGAIAQLAHDIGLHYFDLTEDMSTANTIKELGKSAAGLMAPHCGFAPGFVGIVGADLISQFDVCRKCNMRGGALPQYPTGLMAYALNWSPEGVVNQYLNDCEVIENGQRKMVSPMQSREILYVNGVKLEAFTTSGGVGTMCETYHGLLANLDYKSIRYPGHMDLMNFFFHELLMRERRKEAIEILVNAKPPVDDDIVYVHISAEGHIAGNLTRREFVRAYKPMRIAGEQRTAIAWTTAASVVAVIEMVRNNQLPNKGLLKQEDVPLQSFLRTQMGALYAS